MQLPLDEIFGGFDFGEMKTVAVAISGGSDSTALLFLLQDYFKTLSIAPRIIAITIDHGLRPESGREAHEVSALCARNGIEHVTSGWSGSKPETGVQSAARNARYALLSEAAARSGATLVLTGHTFDDQIETVAMRMARDGSTANAGLAGISPCTLAFNDLNGGEPVWFARPLLHVRRSALRDYLKGRCIGWIDDPSNTNEKYERVAVRQTALDETMLARVQGEAAARRNGASQNGARLIERFAQEVTPGLVFVASEIGDEPLAVHALTALIAFAGGAGWMAEPSSADAILQGLADFKAGTRKVPLRLTASGALIDVRKDGVYLLREKREVLEAAKRAAFDGFYREVATAPTGPSFRGGKAEPGIQSSGGENSDEKVGAVNVHKASSLFTSSSGTALWIPGSATRPRNDGVMVAALTPPSLLAHARATHPMLESAPSVRRLLNPWPDLVPLFDLEMALALTKMAGLPALPEAPIHFDDKN